jgi:hypothetical protein
MTARGAHGATRHSAGRIHPPLRYSPHNKVSGASLLSGFSNGLGAVRFKQSSRVVLDFGSVHGDRLLFFPSVFHPPGHERGTRQPL